MPFKSSQGSCKFLKTWILKTPPCTRAHGRGELSPSELSTILSTLQCSLQCSGRTTCSIVLLCLQCNTIVSTIHCILRAFSLLLSHYLVPITFSLLSLSRHYHFLATARLEFPPSLFLSLFFRRCFWMLFRFFSTFRYVSVVLATLHFEKA